MQEITSIAVAYLLGSIPFAYIVGRRAAHLDIRKYGTRNVGTLNVLEVLGPPEALFTLAGDMGKGIGAVLFARMLSVNEAVMMLVAFVAVAGHSWPIWLRFHGGKGLATTIGVSLILAPVELMLVGVVYITLFFLLKRHSPLSNVLAFLSLPLLSWFLGKPPLFVLGFFAIALLRMLRDFGSWYHEIGRISEGQSHRPLRRLALLLPSIWKKSSRD